MSRLQLVITCTIISLFHIMIISAVLIATNAYAGNGFSPNEKDLLIYLEVARRDVIFKKPKRHLHAMKIIRRHSDFQRKPTKLINATKLKAGKQLRWL
jgi:hypothetical protein